MKERRTFLLPANSGLEANDVQVSKSRGDVVTVSSKIYRSGREGRIIIALGELSDKLRAFLVKFHELHFRFASRRHSGRVFAPVLSRTTSGFHVFFTPIEQDASTHLCNYLRVLGVVANGTTCETFTKPPILSERFTSSSTYQFYAAVSDDLKVVSSLSQILCSTKLAGSDASTTSNSQLSKLCTVLDGNIVPAYVDLDFDVISQTVTITTFQDYQLSTEIAQSITRPIDVELELGVMQQEAAAEAEELSMGGFYMNVDGEDHPHGTLFSFPARHHSLANSVSYLAQFEQPTGLHPKLDITLTAADLGPPKESCALHAYWTLPSAVFIDRHQFSDALFLASQNLVALRTLSGEQDLEAPNWAINTWGSAALFELAHPTPGTTADEWHVTIPTHLRYMKPPSNPPLAIPWPIVFWACQANEGLKFSTNPFDRVNLGYDGLFGPKTMFYHIQPAPQRELYAYIHVPTLDLMPAGATLVTTGTTIAVALGFLWTCWKLLSPIHRRPRGSSSITGAKKLI